MAGAVILAYLLSGLVEVMVMVGAAVVKVAVAIFSNSINGLLGGGICGIVSCGGVCNFCSGFSHNQQHQHH